MSFFFSVSTRKFAIQELTVTRKVLDYMKKQRAEHFRADSSRGLLQLHCSTLLLRTLQFSGSSKPGLRVFLTCVSTAFTPHGFDRVDPVSPLREFRRSNSSAECSLWKDYISYTPPVTLKEKPGVPQSGTEML